MRLRDAIAFWAVWYGLVALYLALIAGVVLGIGHLVAWWHNCPFF